MAFSRVSVGLLALAVAGQALAAKPLIASASDACSPRAPQISAKRGPDRRTVREADAPAATAPASFFASDQAIGELARPYIDKRQAKGLVIGLIDPNGARRILVFGDAGDSARPLSGKSVFEIGSITKTFTGAILADMVRRGTVRLDDPVSKYLPEGVAVPSFQGRDITLLDLATHSSGLPRFPTGYVQPDASKPYAYFGASDLYAFLARFELTQAPGTKFEYSNLGMGLLGHALARAAHARSFKSLVTDRILRPLGMSMTAYGRQRPLKPWMTKGYDQQGRPAAYFDVDALAGGGGLNSNACDLLTYLEANMGEPSLPIERAIRDARGNFRNGPRAGIHIGLGWLTTIRGAMTLVGHNGGTAGYSTYLAFDPVARAGVVVLANSGGFEFADYIGRELLRPERRLPSAASGRGGEK